MTPNYHTTIILYNIHPTPEVLHQLVGSGAKLSYDYITIQYYTRGTLPTSWLEVALALHEDTSPRPTPAYLEVWLALARPDPP